jgi:hypothetical protein
VASAPSQRVLVNGRRYQDFDLQGFDFSSIPLNSIERIEITRDNSGTVLYDDGAFLAAVPFAAYAADDILDAVDQARKAYQSGDMASAKQSLDVASQLIAQKNAKGFVALLRNPLLGWKAEKAQATAVGAAMFGGASAASRSYTNEKGDNIEVSITGDSAMIMQFDPLLNNPAMAGAMGKLVRVGDQRAIQTNEGDVMMLIANKYLIHVQGSGDAAAKLAYAQAVDVGKLSKM